MEATQFDRVVSPESVALWTRHNKAEFCSYMYEPSHHKTYHKRTGQLLTVFSIYMT